MLLNTAIQRSFRPNFELNLSIALFDIEIKTLRGSDFKTNIYSRIEVNASVSAETPSNLKAISIEARATAVGVAKKKLTVLSAMSSIQIDQLNKIANIEDQDTRRDEIAELTLNTLAQMQSSMIISQLNTTKFHDHLHNDKTFQNWLMDKSKPLNPKAKDLEDKSGIIDSTFQALSEAYIEISMYLSNLLDSPE